MLDTGKPARTGLRRLGSRSATKEALRAEREQARTRQAGLLPREPLRMHGFHIASAWRPSEEVSGDYFDVFPLDQQRLALCIGDVSGKGLAAVTLMGELHAAVRQHAPETDTPAELCARVNRSLCASSAQTRYASMFYAILDRHGALHYESAGHCLPLLLRKNGDVEFPASFSGVIGLFSHWLYQNQQTQLHPGDCLLLITDGILRAENRRQEEFGYQRLIVLANKSRANGPNAMADAILSAVTEFCDGRLQDDASLLVICREGSSR